MPLVLELFKGTGSWGKVFKKAGYKVISHDIEEKFNPSIVGNILNLDHTKLPVPDVIVASPPCNSFSNLAYAARSRDAETMRPLKPQAVLGDKILAKTIQIIKYFLAKNPKLKFVIENPHGTMWRSPIMKRLRHSRALTHYNLYGDERRKPTDFFNNFNLQLKDPHDYPSKKPTKLVVDLPLCERYKIPGKLIKSIVKQI